MTYHRRRDTHADLAAEQAGGYRDVSPLAEMERLVSVYHDVVERLLRAWIATCDWGGTTGAVGLPGEAWMHLEVKLPRRLGGQLRAVADRLPVLPHMRDAFDRGRITFDQLATFVSVTKACNGAVLARLDEELAVRADAYADVGMDPDQLGWDAESLVADLRAPGWAERQERRREYGSELRIQGDLDGGVALSASFTAADAAPVVTMLEAAAGPPSPGVSRPHQRAKGMVSIAEHVLGAECDAAPARPTMTLVVDLETATPDRFGRLLKVATGDRAPTLSARATDAIAAGAELRLLLTAGHNPLAEMRAEDIPAAVRRSVHAVHGECSLPGCHRPSWQCDLNHLTPRADGGTHAPANLAPACRAHHTLFHAHDWAAVKDAATGTVTFTHTPTGRRYSSLPDGSRPPPWDRDDFRLDAGLAPPIPPPPEHPPWVAGAREGSARGEQGPPR